MSDRTRTRLLHALKAAGPQTAADLSKGLDVTPVAVRQHLDGLLGEDLVGYEDTRQGGVGRPKRIWSLTQKGHGRFPDNHSGLILGLLSGLKDLYGEDGVDRLIAHRQAATREAYSREIGKAGSLRERLDILADLRSREGYMASVEADGDGFLLIENHCSICAAATACQGFCRAEMDLFKDILGDDVALTREEHLLSGDRRCVYRVRETAS